MLAPLTASTTAKETLYVPAAVYVCEGFLSVETSPSPNAHAKKTGPPGDVSVKSTVSGAVPDVADAVKSTIGGGIAGPMNRPKTMGWVPTFSVEDTVLVAADITETESLSLFATITFVPSGLTAIPAGYDPTEIVAVTVLVAVSITDTVLPPKFAA
jgi:hypothetical protein